MSARDQDSIPRNNFPVLKNTRDHARLPFELSECKPA
jgi:hypothetical protein